MQNMQNMDDINYFISNFDSENIKLLRNKDVIKWIYGDTSFLPPFEKINKTKDKLVYKKLEDEWGRNMLKTVRSDLKLDKQWTNSFGEYIVQEILILNGFKVHKPKKIKNYQPDIETKDVIIEVKTGTYFTEGTAHEKILGCPFKYCEIPNLYDKPLKIVCLGGAERRCKNEYGNLEGEKRGVQKKKFLEFFKDNGIEFISATDMISDVITK